MRLVVYQKGTVARVSDVMIDYAAKCLEMAKSRISFQYDILQAFINEPVLLFTHSELQTLMAAFARYLSVNPSLMSRITADLIPIIDSIGEKDGCIIRRSSGHTLLFCPIYQTEQKYIRLNLTDMLWMLRHKISLGELPDTSPFTVDWDWFAEFVDKPVMCFGHKGYCLDGSMVYRFSVPLRFIEDDWIDEDTRFMTNRLRRYLSRYNQKPVVLVFRPSHKSDLTFALPQACLPNMGDGCRRGRSKK